MPTQVKKDTRTHRLAVEVEARLRPWRQAEAPSPLVKLQHPRPAMLSPNRIKPDAPAAA
jgi:hypothetical protein